MCLASRKFGTNGEVELLLRPSPLGEGLEISFVQKRSTDRHAVLDGNGQIQAGPSGPKTDASFKAWRSRSHGGRVLIVSAKQSLLDNVSNDSWLAFTGPKENPVAVQMRQFGKLQPVLADCKRKVAQHWGVDMSTLDRIAVPAEPADGPAKWVSIHDYPMDALRSGKSGLVTLLYQVGVNGSVDECRVIETSGVSSLETASCRAIEKRAKYKPAQDRDGKPMVSWEIRRIWWVTTG